MDIVNRLTTSLNRDEENLYVWTKACFIEFNKIWGTLDAKKLNKAMSIVKYTIMNVYAHFANKNWHKEVPQLPTTNKNLF
jgi:hypothetical protein